MKTKSPHLQLGKNERPKFLEYVKRKTNLPKGKFSEIMGLDLNQKMPEDEHESRILLNERQMFWNQILNIGQWLLLGKDTRDCMEYEQVISELSSDITAKFQFPTSISVNSEHADRKALKKPTKRIGRARVQSDYYHYLHVDDVFPDSCRGYVDGHIAMDIDVQALELALHDLTDENIPFNAKRFIHYIEPSQVEFNVNSLSLDVLSNVFNIKKNMLKDDWIRIKNLYVELKMKGLIEIKKVCSQVLTMAIQSFPQSSAATWYNKIGNKRKLSALKLGSLFLNIFHICYMEASQEVKINSLKDINGNLNLSTHFANQESVIFNRQQPVVPNKQTQTTNTKTMVKRQAQQRKPRTATTRNVATQFLRRPNTAKPLEIIHKNYLRTQKPGYKPRLGVQTKTNVKRNVLKRTSNIENKNTKYKQ